MNTALQSLAGFLKSKEMRYTVSGEGDVLAFNFTGKHFRWTTIAQTDESGAVITLLSQLPVNLPAAQRTAGARLLANINYGRRQVRIPAAVGH
jgi:hypothetical protein